MTYQLPPHYTPETAEEWRDLWFQSPLLTPEAAQWGREVIKRKGFTDIDNAIDRMMEDINIIYDYRYYHMTHGIELDPTTLEYDPETLLALATQPEVRAYVSVLSNLVVHRNTPKEVIDLIGSMIAHTGECTDSTAHSDHSHTLYGWWNSSSDFLEKAHLALADEIITSELLEYCLFQRIITIPGVVMYADEALEKAWNRNPLEFEMYSRAVAPAAYAETMRVDTITETPINVYETLSAAPVNDPDLARNIIDLGLAILDKAYQQKKRGEAGDRATLAVTQVLKTLNPSGETFLADYITDTDLSKVMVAAATL